MYAGWWYTTKNAAGGGGGNCFTEFTFTGSVVPRAMSLLVSRTDLLQNICRYFQSLEVVDRGSETQLQVAENTYQDF